MQRVTISWRVYCPSWFDSYGGLVYDDSSTGYRPFPTPDSVGYQGQWGAYTDVESRRYEEYLRWVFVDGDYYHPLTGSFLTRRSAGTNEYSAGVNPTNRWGRVVGGTLAGIAGGILTGGNPFGVAAGVALFEGLYSAAEGKPASVVVRDAVLSGALTYAGARALQPVEAVAAQVLSRGAQQAAKELPPVVIGERNIIPRRALPPHIVLRQERLEHIVLRHWPTSGTSAFEPPSGKFAADITARKLIRMLRTAGERGTWSSARGRRFVIEYDFGHSIGVDRLGNPASRLRTIIEPTGEVVTAYPF